MLFVTADGTTDNKHVMISYQWDSQETVLKIRDRLREAGFDIWIDVEDMCTYELVGFSVICIVQMLYTNVESECVGSFNWKWGIK